MRPGPHRQAALRLHPDKCQLDGSKEAFQKLSAAFGCLSEPDERAYYDRVGSERSASAVGPAGPSRIVAHLLCARFTNLFGACISETAV